MDIAPTTKGTHMSTPDTLRTDSRYYVLTISDGTTISDKSRNTWGGYTNMIRRIEKELGSRVRITGAGETGEVADGRTFTIAEFSA
jgi:hypothetical protein